jgi:hypothetical protein
MNNFGRYLMIVFVTYVIVLFVTDFQAVVDGFASFVDAISAVISPLKGGR